MIEGILLFGLDKKEKLVQSMYNDILQGIGVPAKCLAWKIKNSFKD